MRDPLCGVLAQILVKWWAEYPEQLLARRVVAPLQAYLTSELVITKKLTVSVMNTIKVRTTARAALYACLQQFAGKLAGVWQENKDLDLSSSLPVSKGRVCCAGAGEGRGGKSVGAAAATRGLLQ